MAVLTETFEVVKETPASRPASQPESQSESGPASRGPETKPEPKWVVAGAADQTLDKSKVESWIKGLARVTLSDPIGTEKKPEYGFEKPTATGAARP